MIHQTNSLSQKKEGGMLISVTKMSSSTDVGMLLMWLVLPSVTLLRR